MFYPEIIEDGSVLSKKSFLQISLLYVLYREHPKKTSVFSDFIAIFLGLYRLLQIIRRL